MRLRGAKVEVSLVKHRKQRCARLTEKSEGKLKKVECDDQRSET